MKLSLAVGILSSQTLLPVVSEEAKVLSTTKLDTDYPRSSEQSWGGSTLVHVGSTTTTSLKEATNTKAVECIPPPRHGDFTEADYDLGVLECATSTSHTISGQICVPSDDSTLGGYCMDPPLLPLTDAAENRHLLKQFSDDGFFRKVCEETSSSFSPFDYCSCSVYGAGLAAIDCRVDPVPYNSTCGLETATRFAYTYDVDGSLYSAYKYFRFGSAYLKYGRYPQGQCIWANSGANCERCFNLDDIAQPCPPAQDSVFCRRANGCAFECVNDFSDAFLFGCVTPLRTPAGSCSGVYVTNPFVDCQYVDGSVMIYLDNGLIIDTSIDNPWKDLPVIQACNAPKTKAPKPKKTPKPKTPKPTKAPKPKKTPKPKRPRQLLSSEKSDVDSAEQLLIDPMNNLKEAVATKEDANV